jgi:uncharacterized FAD-dependent dehydrogenase
MKGYLLENLTLSHEMDGPGALRDKLSRLLGYDVGPADFSIWRRSLDTRAKANIHWNYSVLLADGRGVPGAREVELELPEIPLRALGGAPRPVVVGFGPSGIFAAYFLAKAGLCPIVFERGGAVSERAAAVESFWRGGALNPETNVQFGEGGAGTFSDGKLTSRSKDPAARWIREILVEHGANQAIRYESKAHVGTDKLQEIIPRIRASITALGGEVLFNAKVTGLTLRNGTVEGVVLADGSAVGASAVILAVGHSARDTFAMLRDAGVPLEPKPFAVGMRVEHRQEFINEMTYGNRAIMSKLPPAEYVLTHKVGERGVYSFCMCPGGEIVDATSESGGLVVNGMSYSNRAGEFANSALVVSVGVDDFHRNDPLDGVEWQRTIERVSARVAQGRGAPASDLRSFLNGAKPCSLEGYPRSSWKRDLVPADLTQLFPPFIARSIAAALPHFERTVRNFGGSNPLLVAPETRTSSPVRIVRNPELLMSVGCAGLYPAGEGAGYAGGIISAAIDGWRVATRVAERFTAES